IGPLVVGGHYALLSGGQKETFISLFQTGWFVESLLTQTMVVYTLRTHKKPFIESLPSPILLTATLLAMLVGLTLPYTPLGSYFGMHPLPWFYYVILLIPTLVMYLLLAQFVKGVFIKRYGELY
ncbi:MAG: cation transporting ATPase C-terminal domain-containing protein, partial [Aquificaceae bacterium]